MKTFSLAKRANYAFLSIVILAIVIPLSVQFYKNATSASEEKVRTLKIASEFSSKSLAESLIVNQMMLSAQQTVSLCQELNLISCELFDAHGKQIYLHQNKWTEKKVSTYTYILMFNGKLAGKIRYTYLTPTFTTIFLSEVTQLLLIIGLFLGIAYLCFQRFLKEPLSKFQLISFAMKNKGLDEVIANFDQLDTPVEEIQDLKEAVKSRLIGIKGYERIRQEESELSVLHDLSMQVAHDIRSPLLALSIATKSLDVLPESTRLLIKSAIDRIRDISNDLSRKTLGKGNPSPAEATSNDADCQILSALIEEIVTEKRVEYRSRPEVSIDCFFNEESYGLFSIIEAVEFKRIISNLINNSMEAIEGTGQITLFLNRDLNENIILRIQDSGHGFPKAVLTRGIQKGVSYGKPAGTGLGLYHAQKMIQKWGGDLILESKREQGSSVIIKLKKTDAPEWFVRELILNEHQKVIVLDDDDAVHHVWDTRFNQSNLIPRIQHFSDLQTILQNSASSATGLGTICLIDHGFVGQTMNGLDLIENLKIMGNSILVTNRYDDLSIQKRCIALGVKLIPKGMVGLIPIQIISTQKELSLDS